MKKPQGSQIVVQELNGSNSFTQSIVHTNEKSRDKSLVVMKEIYEEGSRTPIITVRM